MVSVAAYNFRRMAALQKLILDTDIGDDIDDALALALICASPELDLVGVTTVSGNVAARCRQARTILKCGGAHYANVPVCAGCGASLSQRPLSGLRDYLEGKLPSQHASCLPEAELGAPDLRHGVDLLVETIMGSRGDVVPVTIGPMTNLAMAMIKEPRIVAKIPRIVAMAGEFRHGFAEYNVRCDPEAAAICFRTGVPIDITPCDIGMRVRLGDAELARLSSSGRALAKNLTHAIRCFQQAHSKPDHPAMPSLFDPMAVATMVRPELCAWKRGRVSVELQGSATFGFTTFEEDPSGHHRVAWEVNAEASIGFWLGRVLEA